LKQRTRVKICGITRVEDAVTAATLGTDAIGLVFYPKSPRYVEIEEAAEICARIPAFVTTVALFMDANEQQVSDVLQRVPIDLLQFHGTETPDYCNRFNRPYIKALGMAGEARADIISKAGRFTESRGILLDSHAPGAAGGTGEAYDWNSMPEGFDKPVILAGGLGVDNVAEAITKVHPWAVDVSSGVEADKGIKSADLMSEFINEVNNANR
jgi:phosphoribosylanthranilate isomerase